MKILAPCVKVRRCGPNMYTIHHPHGEYRETTSKNWAWLNKFHAGFAQLALDREEIYEREPVCAEAIRRAVENLDLKFDED